MSLHRPAMSAHEAFTLQTYFALSFKPIKSKTPGCCILVRAPRDLTMPEQRTKVNLMTYAVGVRLQRGLVFAADTRTNAGIDNVSQFRKLHFWRKTGDRVLVLLTAGNLAISQSVISIINEQLSAEAPTDRPTLMNVSSMYRAARLVGDAVREVRAIDGASLDASKTGFSVSCILGGQVGDEAPRLFQIYDEGNFIEATDDTPYLQIGEHKYGKPILDRVVHPEMRLGEVAKLILLSFDATLRSNLSVGMPIDLLLYERDTLDVRRVRRIDENDDYYRKLSNQWAETLRAAVASMDEYKD